MSIRLSSYSKESVFLPPKVSKTQVTVFGNEKLDPSNIQQMIRLSNDPTAGGADLAAVAVELAVFNYESVLWTRMSGACRAAMAMANEQYDYKGAVKLLMNQISLNDSTISELLSNLPRTYKAFDQTHQARIEACMDFDNMAFETLNQILGVDLSPEEYRAVFDHSKDAKNNTAKASDDKKVKPTKKSGASKLSEKIESYVQEASALISHGEIQKSAAPIAQALRYLAKAEAIVELAQDALKGVLQIDTGGLLAKISQLRARAMALLGLNPGENTKTKPLAEIAARTRLLDIPKAEPGNAQFPIPLGLSA